jgi:tRNA(Arg) A34 adenosine deaminase TadA
MIKNGKVIATAKNQYCSKKKLSHFRSKRIWSVHAEMSLATSVPKHVARGSTVCVVRVNKQGQLVNSEPCEMCKKILSTLGVKNVYYS